MEALVDGIVDEDEILSYYQVIDDESIKMSKIIKDLLQLSQLETDTIKFKMIPIEIKGYLEDKLNRYKHIAIQKNIEFTCQLNVEDDLKIIGDELRLEQGITNLLSNAFKHSDKYVYVDLIAINDGIMLSIENSGEPIDSGDLNNIFDSFYKGKTSTKKEGTGLGLSIASKIFIKHKMDYRVYNKKHAVIFELNMSVFGADIEIL
jgi:signal transduction histidine kinase